MSFNCKHEFWEHTVWWWVNYPNHTTIPVPHSAKFDNRAEAIEAVRTMIEDPSPSLRWIKVFRSDNETYTCYRWENPEEEPAPIIWEITESPKKWWQFWRS